MATPPQPRRQAARPAPVASPAPAARPSRARRNPRSAQAPAPAAPPVVTTTTTVAQGAPVRTTRRVPARRRTALAPAPTPTNWKKIGWWVLGILGALLLCFLVWKYGGSVLSKIGGSGSEGTSVPFKQIPISADTPAGATLETGSGAVVKAMANPSSSSGSSVIVAFSTNVTVIIGGVPHRTGTDNVRIHEATPPSSPLSTTPTVAPPLPIAPPPAVPVWPRDFAPDKELTVLRDCCNEGRVIVPPGKYYLFHLPPKAGWKVTPTVWGPPVEEFDTAINGMAVNKDPGTPFSGIRTYGFRNNSSQNLEILFKFSKRPGWVARQFGAR